MAWIFSLSAECGYDEDVATAFAAHFQGFTVRLAEGSAHLCKADKFHWGGAWWVCVCPDGVSQSGIRNDEERRQLTAIGFVLYDKLREAPPYRYALVGVEVDGFMEFEEMDEDVANINGLVLSDEVWEHLGSPGMFVPFEAGFHWRPLIEAR